MDRGVFHCLESMEYDYIALLQKALVVLFCGTLMAKIVRHMWSFVNVEKEPVKVLVTGAAGMLSPSFNVTSDHLSPDCFHIV